MLQHSKGYFWKWGGAHELGLRGVPLSLVSLCSSLALDTAYMGRLCKWTIRDHCVDRFLWYMREAMTRIPLTSKPAKGD